MKPNQIANMFSGGAVEPGEGGANWSHENLLNGGHGFNLLRGNEQRSSRLRVQIAECASVWGQFLNQRVHPLLMLEAISGGFDDFTFNKLKKLAPTIFQEAMTRGDFTNLTSYVIDRVLYEAYTAFPKSWEAFANVNRRVKDFRAVERWIMEGGEAPFQKVGELAGFNRMSPLTDKYTYQVYKYEKGAGMSWEAVINDDLNMFARVPTGIAEGGVRTIEQYVLSLIAGAAGPNSAFYGTAIALKPTGTIKNVIDTSSYSSGSWSGANNPKLDVMNLIMASGLFMNQMTYEGRPINPMADDLVVLVGDGILYQTLMNIINTNQIVTTILGGVKASSAVESDIALQAKNWISGRIRPVYAPELRNICTSNLATSWWLFASPGGPRPCVEVGFLSGYDRPVLYRKAANTQRISGGIDEQHGDFETMSTDFKGMLVMGGTRMDPRLTMASNGTGS